jgi:regulation of enolase protein 1 (concanavalin A-like superfamily)
MLRLTVLVVLFTLAGCAMLEVPRPQGAPPVSVPAFELSWQTKTWDEPQPAPNTTVSPTGMTLKTSSYAFAYRAMQSDGTFTTRVPELSAGTRAGLMVRGSLDLQAKGLFAYADPGQPFTKRAAPEEVVPQEAELLNLPISDKVGAFYLKLERSGNRVTVSLSTDGTAWQVLISMTLELPSTIYVGLALDAGKTGNATITFGEVSVSGTIDPPASNGWSSSAVGEPRERNTDGTDTLAMTVNGGRIGGTGDSFPFLYKYLEGDFDLSARVNSFSATNDKARAGLMVRESLASDAAAGFIRLTAQQGVSTETRQRTGETMRNPNAAKIANFQTPVWLRLERAGAVLNSYVSTDGETWQRLVSLEVRLPDAVYVGFAVAANDNSTVSAEFTSVDCKGTEPTTPPVEPTLPPPLPEPPTGAPPPAPTPVNPSERVKVILHQQPGSRTTVDAVAASLTTIEALPVDGITVSSYEGWNLMSPGVRYSYDDLYQTYSKLEGKFSKVNENYALVLIDYPGDLFDDAAWQSVIENWRNLAAALRDTGFKGIFFDNEEYQTPWFNYPEDFASVQGNLANYQAQTRLRGKQLMEAVSSVFPNIQVLTFHGPYLSEPKTPESVKLTWGYSASEFELSGAFFVGFMEGRTNNAVVIDGGEFYLYRTYEHFRDSYVWRKVGMGLTSTDSSFIPSSLRDERWSQNISISFGLYNVSYPDPVVNRMDGSIMATTLGNARCAADQLVWVYVEDTRNWYGGEMPADFREGLENSQCPLQAGGSQ